MRLGFLISIVLWALIGLVIYAGVANATYDPCGGDGALTNGADLWTGTINNDSCRGLDGNDIMSGKQGADNISGDSGNDQLEGNAGSDSLFGGTGKDDLYGSDGNDDLHDQDGATNGFLKCGPGDDDAYADWNPSTGNADTVDASCERVHWNILG